MFCAELYIAHRHGVRVHQRRATKHHMHLREQAFVYAIQPQNFARTIGLECFPIERGRAHRPAKPARFLNRIAEMRRVAVEFFRNAAEVDAGAAHRSGLRQRDTCTTCCSHTCSAHTAAAAADYQ